ncbi:uncharacterized protein LOC134509713 isoform X1 [Chroicocephalus ridibundus]|uniref:uncharacterized protein LOC134509713 isoform X1 n=1 Tax=Chroicocephalus ridibundus TaxID=1192867 RepID=UPI002FDCC331
MVEDCMRDTILLYSFQLRKKQHLSFAFKDIGVLSCQDGVLCMRFYYDYVTGLESKASRMALLHTRLWVRCAVVSGGAATTWGMQAAPDRMFPSFRFVVISTVVVEALANQHKKAAEQQRIRRGTVWHPEKLLQSFPSPCCQARVQAEGSKTWGRRLLPGKTLDRSWDLRLTCHEISSSQQDIAQELLCLVLFSFRKHGTHQACPELRLCQEKMSGTIGADGHRSCQLSRSGRCRTPSLVHATGTAL